MDNKRIVVALDAPFVVNAADVPEYLGPPKIKNDAPFRLSRPGVVTGLAWTETGGDVLYVEFDDANILYFQNKQAVLRGTRSEWLTVVLVDREP